MKKILFAFVAGVIPALAATNQTFAQAPGVVASAGNLDHFSTRPNTAGLEKSTTLNGSEVNTKALKHFNKFYHVDNEQWFKSQDGIVASFTSDGKLNFIYYDKKGRWAASLKGYKEDKMDPGVRRIVKPRYYDYKITYVQEVKTTLELPQPTYFVYIESDKDFKTIRINDGEMDVYKEFNRN